MHPKPNTSVEYLKLLETMDIDPDIVHVKWARETSALADIVANPTAPKGLLMGAVAQLYYTARRLVEVMVPHMTPEQFEENYASVALSSYPSTQRDLEQDMTIYRYNGVSVNISLGSLGEDDRHYYRMLSSHDQMSRTHGLLLKGQLLHSQFRNPPPIVRITVDGRELGK